MTNKELCDLYPWLIPTNRWTGKVVKDYDYSYTELDSLPDGWRRAFGEQMCKELNDEIKTWSEKEQANFRITQIKEKWGSLRFYTNGESAHFRDIIGKYTTLSRRTCIKCGAPARWISRGWISPWCDDCAHFIYDEAPWFQPSDFEGEYMDINEYYSEIEKEED